MVASIQALDLTMSGGKAASASARSVGDVLAAFDGLAHRLVEAFPDFFSAEGGDLRLDIGNLFRAEPIDSAALRAGEVILKPSERYIELVSAISRDWGVAPDFDLHFVHSWPILFRAFAPSRTMSRTGGAGNGVSPEARP